MFSSRTNQFVVVGNINIWLYIMFITLKYSQNIRITDLVFMASSGKNTQCSAKICSNNYSSNPSNSSLLDIPSKGFCRLMLTNWRVTPEISNTEEVSTTWQPASVNFLLPTRLLLCNVWGWHCGKISTKISGKISQKSALHAQGAILRGVCGVPGGDSHRQIRWTLETNFPALSSLSFQFRCNC